jgi:hypothetical protein
MVRSTAAALGLFLALVLGARAAAATQSRIAVLQPDEELLRAVSLALSAWGLQTLRSDASFPSSTLPEAVRMASHLAEQLDVEALVWVTRLEQGSLIWVFDAATGDMTMRRLPESSPFDSAAAAAVALSVKTALRSTAVAPPSERLVSRDGLRAEHLEAPEPTPVRANRAATVELGAVGHWLARDTLALELRLAGSLWFRKERKLGLTLGASWSPGLAIDVPAYRGRYRDFSAFGRACYRPIQASIVSTTIAFGGALHWTALDGTLVADGSERGAQRVSASLDLEASIAASVAGPFYLGAVFGGSYLPAYPRYLIAGQPIFSPAQLTAYLGAFSGVAVF